MQADFSLPSSLLHCLHLLSPSVSPLVPHPVPRLHALNVPAAGHEVLAVWERQPCEIWGGSDDPPLRDCLCLTMFTCFWKQVFVTVLLTSQCPRTS
ncbi:hypothetical protein CesoFtcFv8_003913 [Champsocephalus esox]|uniref:Uncharacterized protein n=1 Tax=Champsocephalus esox TaxID=159716 RepID=A0AAN8CXQ0_9TELE|nr:hypothetical protein CesoFtcFv8_003913 [Champsocephalus esox]